MVDPTPLELSPERLQQIQQLTDETWLRRAMYPPPKAAVAPAPLTVVPRRLAEPST